jgi:hypothetical protein
MPLRKQRDGWPSGPPRRISALVGLLSILGFMWAVAQGLITLSLLQSDETGGACDAPEPALAATATLAVLLAVASVWFALIPRNARAAVALAAEVAMCAIWVALGAWSAWGCVIE